MRGIGTLRCASDRLKTIVSFRQVCTRDWSKIWLAVVQVGDPPATAPHLDSTRRRSGDRASTASSVKTRAARAATPGAPPAAVARAVRGRSYRGERHWPPSAKRESNLRPLRAQVTEPPYADPHVRWCDRESVRSPTFVDAVARGGWVRGDALGSADVCIGFHSSASRALRSGDAPANCGSPGGQGVPGCVAASHATPQTGGARRLRFR
jgi:hypothetical protein